jgi:hypothetical protein
MEDLVIEKLQEYDISLHKDDISGLLNPEFDNYLTIKDYEVLIELLQGNYNITVDKIPKFKGVKFGCELETYFIKDCRKEDFDGSFILDEKVWDDEIYDELILNADETYLNLLRENIIPYLTPKFLKKFPYAYIANGALNYTNTKPFIILNLSNGEILDKTYEIDTYKYISFIVDGTLTSGDYKNLIPCEIVSPVLDDIEDLRILYEGLINTKCNFSDDTAGFHVNISTIDENGYPIKLSRGMITEIVRSWMVYEEKNIHHLRNKNTSIHIPYEYSFGNSLIYEYNNDINNKILNMIIQNKNGKELTKNDIYKDYGLSMWFLSKKYFISDTLKDPKYISIHKKNESLLEFRAFPSRNDTKTLLKYTKDVINMITKVMERYCNKSKYIDTIVNIQKNYLKYELKGKYSKEYLVNIIRTQKLK